LQGVSEDDDVVALRTEAVRLSDEVDRLTQQKEAREAALRAAGTERHTVAAELAALQREYAIIRGTVRASCQQRSVV
jgi:hypothetical protein